MMVLRKFGSAMAFLILGSLHVGILTDWTIGGVRDPLGPYPRIPDREKLKKEIAFAEECKKYIIAPKERFM